MLQPKRTKYRKQFKGRIKGVAKGGSDLAFGEFGLKAQEPNRVNAREIEVYFARPVLRMMIQQPLVAAARAGQYDVICTVAGGGLSGQAGAVRHGISKALTYFEPDLRGVLKKGGFLTRDSRVVERKKYGRAKARKSFQFSKR